MKMRWDNPLLTGVVLLVVIICLLGWGTSQALQRAIALDRKDYQLKTSALLHDMKSRGDQFYFHTRTFAAWDDTYNLTPDRYEAYCQANLSLPLFHDLGWHHVVMLNATGSVTLARSWNASSNSITATPIPIQEWLTDYRALRESATGNWGFHQSDRTYLVAWHPILNSAYEGPARGTFIAVQELEKDFLARWPSNYDLEASPATSAGASAPPSDGKIQLRTWPEAMARREHGLLQALDIYDPFGQPIQTLTLASTHHHEAEIRRLAGIFLPTVGGCLLAALALGLIVSRQQHRAASLWREAMLEKLALQAASAGMWRWDQQTRKTTWSVHMRFLHGVMDEQQSVSEDLWKSIIHPEDRVRIQHEVEFAAQNGRTDMIYRILLPNGAIRWLHNVGEVERDSAGQPTSIWNGIVMDVTDRRNAEERLRLNEQRYRAIVENQDDAVCCWKPDTTLTFANARYRELFGIPAGDLQGRRWIDYVPEADRPAVIKVYEELSQAPRNLTYEHWVQLADGRKQWILWVDVPLLDRNGRCTEFQSVGRNLTQRKLAEQALRESEERYRSIVDTAQEGIWMMDAEARTTFVNQRMADMLGYEIADMMDRSFFDFMDEEARKDAHQYLEHRKAGLRERHDLRFRQRDGRALWCILSSSSILDSEGRFTGALALITDITGRKMMEQDLLARESLFRTVFEGSPLGMALDGPDGRLVRVNQAMADMLGYSIEDLERGTFVDHTHPDDLARDWDLFRQLTLGEIPNYSLEKRLRHRDGSLVWVRIHCSQTGGPAPVVVVVENITQRRKTELALRTLFEKTALATGGVFFHEMVSQLAEVLEVDYAFVTEVRADGKVHQLALHRRGHGPVENSEGICTRSCEGLHQGRPCLHAQGIDPGCPHYDSLQALNIQGYLGIPVMDSRGHLMGTVGILDTNTIKNPDQLQEILQIFALRTGAELERRRRDEDVQALTRDLEQRVEQRTAQLALQALAMDSTLEGMAVLRDNVYIYMNEPHAAMYGYRPDELLNQTWQALYSAEEQQRLLREVFPLLERDGRWRGEVTGLRKQGDFFTAELSLALARDGHLICSCRDITVARAARDMLNQRSQMLERAGRAKDEFLAAMSHELRTPLAGILMASESLRQLTYGPLTDRQNHMLLRVEDSGKHLLDLINDILDLSKIEAGKVELNREHIQVRGLCEAVLGMMRESAVQKKLSVALEVLPDNLAVDADARRLKQMLLNLLGNAVKFTKEGRRIGIRAQLSEDTTQVLITVWDTGIGIAHKDFHKVFKPFTQIDSSLARHYGGTGLGLTLVLRMAELHGGGVSLKSELGEGSSFTLHLPSAPSQPASPAARPASPPPRAAPMASRQHILVVDDNEVMLSLLSEYLTARGYQVECAHHGTEAISLALMRPPDIILLDIQMPGMDGFEVTRTLRRHSDHAIARVPIIALTALVMPGDRERCLVAGMNEYLTKPVRMTELLDVVQRLSREHLKGRPT